MAGAVKMTLAKAIEVLQAEVDAFNQGTLNQPVEGSMEWYLLRGKTLGLSALKRMEQLELSGDPLASERYYREATKRCKTAEVPPEQPAGDQTGDLGESDAPGS